MHGLHCAAFCAILLCPIQLYASTVFRCVDSAGHVTFTLQGCPSEQDQYLQDAYNPTPGSGKPVPLAQSSKSSASQGRRQERANELVVVGERPDGCGNRLIGSARREAMIKQQIRSGMTQADVQSMLGTPDRVSSQNGQQRYHYSDRRGNNRQVSFDETGCVKGKR